MVDRRCAFACAMLNNTKFGMFYRKYRTHVAFRPYALVRVSPFHADAQIPWDNTDTDTVTEHFVFLPLFESARNISKAIVIICLYF